MKVVDKLQSRIPHACWRGNLPDNICILFNMFLDFTGCGLCRDKCVFHSKILFYLGAQWKLRSQENVSINVLLCNAFVPSRLSILTVTEIFLYPFSFITTANMTIIHVCWEIYSINFLHTKLNLSPNFEIHAKFLLSMLYI